MGVPKNSWVVYDGKSENSTVVLAGGTLIAHKELQESYPWEICESVKFGEPSQFFLSKKRHGHLKFKLNRKTTFSISLGYRQSFMSGESAPTTTNSGGVQNHKYGTFTYL